MFSLRRGAAGGRYDGRVSTEEFRPEERFARETDEADALRAFRAEFHVPRAADGSEAVYLIGNSLGLMPRAARGLVDQQMEDWATIAGEAHFHGATPWYSFHELFRESGARLVGAKPGAREVVMMNSLTVNLHLMLASFYRPTRERFRIVIEAGAFPSDEHAVASQARFHGFEPAEAVVRLAPRAGERTLRNDDVVEWLGRHGSGVAVVLLGGVNYSTGQWFDMERITRAGRGAGCVVGWDLAHAAGNVPMRLHDWGVDFAAWCSYKYLNAGPGSIAGCFVHERHGGSAWGGPRLEGWWGTDSATRFKMRPRFEPGPGAEAWQVSNPPILSAAPLKASLDLFDRAGMAALREKSLRLHAYARWLLGRASKGRFFVATPAADAEHGCQLSVVLGERAKAVKEALARAGVVADFREPDVVRVAPVPLYNTFHDVWEFVRRLEGVLEGGA